MAKLNFPASPLTGTLYSENGNVWKWNGTSWISFNSLDLTGQVSGALGVTHGGTGYTTFTLGDLLVGAGNTIIKFPLGGNGYVLAVDATSASGVTWAATGGGSGTVNSGNIYEVPVYLATGNALSGSTNFLNVGTGLSVLYSANSNNSLTGALVVSGGVGIGKSISIDGRLQLFNSSLYTAFVSSQSGISTVYTLPSSTPTATGTSVLASTQSGILSWVPMVASSGGTGTGSGTVNTGNQYEIAYYASNGDAVSGNANFKYNPNNSDFLTLGGMTFVGSGNSAISITNVGNGGQILSTWATLNSGLAIDASNASLRIVGDSNAGTTLVDLGIYDNSGFPTGNWNSKYLFPKSTSAIFVNGLTIENLTQSTNNTSGALIVYGGLGLSGNAFIGGTVTASQFTGSLIGTASTSNYAHQSGYAISSGTATTSTYSHQSGYAITSGIATTAQNVQVQSASTNSSHRLIFTPNNASGVGLSTNSTLVYNPSTDILSVSGLSVTSPIASISTTTGALIVTGGVGIGDSLYTSSTSPDSISGVILNNSVITFGSWAGSIITSRYGGTGFSTFNKGDLLVGDSNSSINRLPVGSDNAVLIGSSYSGYGVSWQPLLSPTYGSFGSSQTQSVGATGITVVSYTTTFEANRVSITPDASTGNTTRIYIQDSGTYNFQFSAQNNLLNTNQPSDGEIWFRVNGVDIPESNSRTTVIGKAAEQILSLNFVYTVVANSYVELVMYSSTTDFAINSFYNLTSPTRPSIPSMIFSVTPVSNILPSGATGITGLASLNAQTGSIQTFAVGEAGDNFNIVSGLNVHTFNIPNAGIGTQRGLITNAAQTIDGAKTFNSDGIFASQTVSTSTTTGALVISGTGGVGIGGSLYVASASQIDGITVANGIVTGSLSGYASTATNVRLNSANENINHKLVFTPESNTAGSALSTNTTLVYNPSTDRFSLSGISVTSGFNSTSNTSGALTVIGGLGITGNAFIGGTVTATLFTGNISATAATATNFYGSLIGTATTAQNINITQTSSNSGFYIPFTAYTSGSGVALSAGLGLSFNPSTNILTTGTVAANISGNVTGYASTANNLRIGSASTSDLHPVLFTPSVSTSGSAISANGSFLYDSINDRLYTSGLSVTSSLGATSTTGALRVSGGLSLAGNAFIGGTVSILDTTNSTSSSTGSLVLSGGAGFAKSINVSGNISARSGFELRTFNTGDTNYASFKYTGSTDTPYTLPTTYPATGTSILQSNTSGTLSWVPMFTSTASGNVNQGNQYSIPYYPSAGTLVTGSSNFNNVPGTGVSIYNPNSDSSSTSTGALVVHGGLGITGKSYLGGIVYITDTTNAVPDGLPQGALQVTGGATIGGTLVVDSALTVGGKVNYAVSNVVAQFISNVNSYSQTIFHNENSGDSASTDVVLSNNLSTDTDTYGDLGINSSGWAATTAAFSTANATYLASKGGDLALGTLSSNNIRFFQNNGVSDIITISGSGMSVFYGTNSTSTTTGAVNIRGGLGITGNAFIGGTVTATTFIGNLSSTAATSTNFYGNLVGTSTTASNLNVADSSSNQTHWMLFGSSQNGTGIAVSSGSGLTFNPSNNYLYVGAPASGRVYAGGFYVNNVQMPNGTGTINRITSWAGSNTINAASFLIYSATGQSTLSINPTSGTAASTVLVINPSSSFAGRLFDVQNNNTSSFIVENDGFVKIINYATIGGTVNITNTTAATGVSSAALVVSGGLGVNGDVFVCNTANSKLSVMQSNGDEGGEIFLNKAQTNTTLNGGVTIDIFQDRLRFFEQGGSARGFYLDISTGGNGVGTNIMGGSSSGTVNSGTATYAAYYPASSNAVSAIADLQFTGTGVSIGGNINPTSSSTGSLKVFGGVGIGGTLFVGGMVRVGTNTFTKNYSQGDIALDNGSSSDTPALSFYYNNNKNFGIDVFSSGSGSTRWRVVKEINETGGAELFSVDTTGTMFINNASSPTNYSGFKYSGSAQTVYTLPSNSPQSSLGTSVLSSTVAGVMSWVPLTSSGSGTINSGTATRLAYYQSSGTAITDTYGINYNVSGTASTLNVFGGAAVGSTIFSVHAISATSVKVGIGVSNPAYELEVAGEISATNKSFVIDHPTKPGMKLRYGSLEGPENGVYVRGILFENNVIETPDYWEGLVIEDTYTVHLTPIGKYQQLYVEKIENYKVYVGTAGTEPINCYYSVWAERKDVPKLKVEY